MSAVSVLVIDWTAMGAPAPTGRPPTLTPRVERRGRRKGRVSMEAYCRGAGGATGMIQAPTDGFQESGRAWGSGRPPQGLGRGGDNFGIAYSPVRPARRPRRAPGRLWRLGHARRLRVADRGASCRAPRGRRIRPL